MSATASPDPRLRSVRREIEELDRALVLLVAARVQAACSAIRLRSEADGRLSDPAQEALVVARARSWAEEAGLPPTLAEGILRAVLAAGKDRYTNAGRALGSVSKPQPRRGVSRSRKRAPIPPDSLGSPGAETPIST
jgi:chorismate mutase